MLTASEISAGYARLQAQKLRVTDQETLLGVFKLYLKNRYSPDFSDLPSRLAAAADTNEVKTASKLAGILVKLEEDGFPEIELSGGRSGLKLDEAKAAVFKVRFALTLLGYDLPEDFSSSLDGGSETGGKSGGIFIPSFIMKTNPRW